jgi:uncharacterized Fe-S cluster protein YjdI
MEEKETRTYTNGEITVTWNPGQCIHSKNCWKGMIEVFNPQRRPWIDLKAASSEAIMAQIDKCPSGALGYYKNEEIKEPVSIESETIIEAAPNGPLMVYGNVVVKGAHGKEERRAKATAFCRCGASGNKPFCDGSHRKVGFVG